MLSDLAAAAVSDAGAEPQLRHEIDSVGVVGTGTMAAGIAEVFAKAGYDVVFVGRSDEKVDGVLALITKNLDKAIAKGKLDEDGKSDVLGRLTGATSRDALGDVDIVVEAIAEDMDVKLELFTDLDRIAKPGAILATTTSSLSIAELAGATGRPQDVVGMHFFNPAPVMKLVEVVSAPTTSPEVAETAKALSTNVGKHPVSCTDRAGFIVNALLFPYLNDAVKLHEAGDDSLEDIDTAMKETNAPDGAVPAARRRGQRRVAWPSSSRWSEPSGTPAGSRRRRSCGWSRRASSVARPARGSTPTDNPGVADSLSFGMEAPGS